ncbi:MAG: phosphoribosylamine--glycine ligase [Spirochaetales bacterium]|nr:phosphoribosylamine--glycine ligase [Candidatus Physcosoma equi]
MRVLVLGSGAKDHALAWWLSRSAYISALYMAPGNPGTADLAYNLSDIDPADGEAVYQAVKEHRIDVVFIGTEAPLLAGVREYLAEKGIHCIGATAEAIKLEDDRAYARAFTQRHNIPVPENALFTDVESLKGYLDKHEGERFTIKSNSMAPSRVMLRSSDKNALVNYAEILLAKGPILLEKYVSGTHITVTLMIDKNGYLLLPHVNEYTNISHENRTPTGGMGAIAPLPLPWDEEQMIKEAIIEPTIQGMKEEGSAYKGVLTLSVVISQDKKPYLVDYHVRLNDPATQVYAPIIKTDFGQILYAMEQDKVSSIKLETTEDCAVAVVLAAPGYPMQPEIGREIKGLSNAFLCDISSKPRVFLGAVKKTSNGRYFTNGGRAITVVGTAPSLEEANAKAYELIKSKKFDSLYYRDDIGDKFFSPQ